MSDNSYKSIRLALDELSDMLEHLNDLADELESEYKPTTAQDWLATSRDMTMMLADAGLAVSEIHTARLQHRISELS